MLRWKKKLEKLYSNEPSEPNEFDLFMDPPENEPDNSGGGETDEVDETDVPAEPDEFEETENEESEENEEDPEDPEDSPKTTDESELSLLRKQNQELLNLVKQLTNKDIPEKVSETESEEIDPFQSEMFKKLQETMNWDTEEATSFKEFFKFFHDEVTNHSVKQALNTTPKIVDETVSRQQKATQIRKDFYSKHPALENVKHYVYQVSSQLAKDNPNITLDKLLNQAAQITYESLGIEKIKSNRNKVKAEQSKKPAFPKSKGVRKKTPTKTALESEIAAMLSLDE